MIRPYIAMLNDEMYLMYLAPVLLPVTVIMLSMRMVTNLINPLKQQYWAQISQITQLIVLIMLLLVTMILGRALDSTIILGATNVFALCLLFYSFWISVKKVDDSQASAKISYFKAMENLRDIRQILSISNIETTQIDDLIQKLQATPINKVSTKVLWALAKYDANFTDIPSTAYLPKTALKGRLKKITSDLIKLMT